MEVKEQRHLQEKQALQGKNEVLQGEKQALQQEKQSLEGENTSLLKCKAEMTTDPLKDLTLKMVMWDDETFTVIRAQKRHADAYMKKYMRQWKGPKRVVDFKRHPNPMSKWAKLRKLLVEENKIKKLEGNHRLVLEAGSTAPCCFGGSQLLQTTLFLNYCCCC